MTQQPLKTVLATIAEHHDGVRQGDNLYELQADGDALIVDVATGWHERHRYVLRAESDAGSVAAPTAIQDRCAVSQRLGSLTQVPCAPHRSVDDACIAHRPIACILADGHEEPCAPGLPPLASDWTLTVNDLCPLAVRDALREADVRTAQPVSVDPSDLVQVEHAQAAKTRLVGSRLTQCYVTDDDYVALFFPSGLYDSAGNPAGAHAGFLVDGEHAGRWGYEDEQGRRAVSDYGWDADENDIARWTRDCRVRRELLGTAHLAFYEGYADSPLCPCGNTSQYEGFWSVQRDGTSAPEGGTGYVACGACGRVYTDIPDGLNAAAGSIERVVLVGDEGRTYVVGAGVQVDVLDPDVVLAIRNA